MYIAKLGGVMDIKNININGLWLLHPTIYLPIDEKSLDIISVVHVSVVRYAGVMQLLFLIGPLCLIGMWFSKDRKVIVIKTHAQRRLSCVFKY
jgi:hypothetical protein